MSAEKKQSLATPAYTDAQRNRKEKENEGLYVVKIIISATGVPEKSSTSKERGEKTMFNIGDTVVSEDPQFVGIVLKETTNSLNENRRSWRVQWNDGDITHYEDVESMSHHKIEAHQWNGKLYKKYMDIICP